jgi:hypothetical protein
MFIHYDMIIDINDEWVDREGRRNGCVGVGRMKKNEMNIKIINFFLSFYLS